MKIRRTLPSVHSYSPLHATSGEKPGVEYTLAKMLSSPENNIVTQRNSSALSPMKRFSQSQNKKRVSFMDETQSKNYQTANQPFKENESRGRISRKFRRTRIFQSSKKSSQKITTNINIKDLSNELAKEAKLNAEEKIIKKISQLQNIVHEIHHRVASHDKNEVRIEEVPGPRSNNDMVNKVLRLQLEQMRRCEKIAKENQVLYGKLVKSIEHSQNQLIGSRRKSRQSLALGSSNSKKKMVHKVTAFEDLQQYERKNAFSLDQSEAQVEIVSPFLLEENRGKIKIAR